MSVVLRCIKCNGILEPDPKAAEALWCPNCKKQIVGGPVRSDAGPAPTHEEQVVKLLTEIRDCLKHLCE